MLFTIVKSPEAVALAETTKNVGKNGASIGRGRDNSWVLPDPERFMSSLHTEIVFKDNKFYAVDHSTNGTFHNDSSTEIGKDNQVELIDGDCLIIGDYEIAVSQLQESDQQEIQQSGPFASVAESAPVIPAVNSFEQDSIPISDSPLSMGISHQISNDKPLLQEEEILDPLIALSASEPVEDVFHVGTQGDAGSALNQSIQFPEMIPDNWLDMPLPNLDEQVEYTNASITEMNYTPDVIHQRRLRSEIGVGAKVSTDNRLQPEVNEIHSRTEESPAPARKPRPKVSRPRNTKMDRVTADVVNEKPKEKAAQRKAVPKNPEISISSNEDLIAALGLNIQDMTDQQIDDINDVVGEFLQVAVKGLMLILKSRSTLKNEFRMSVTTIQSVENNPLKFSPTLEDAMVNMFVRSGNAYIDPVTAIKEGIEGIADHQFAVFAGMRSAFNHLLERFNPQILEAKFNKQKSNSMLSTKKAKNWDFYTGLYEDIIKDRDDSFQYLFGDEFVQAYEQQMQQLKLTRANAKE